jgi:hypothetical protein
VSVSAAEAGHLGRAFNHEVKGCLDASPREYDTESSWQKPPPDPYGSKFSVALNEARYLVLGSGSSPDLKVEVGQGCQQRHDGTYTRCTISLSIRTKRERTSPATPSPKQRPTPSTTADGGNGGSSGQRVSARGCFLAAGALGQLGDEVTQESGIPGMDEAHQNEGLALIEEFQVRPAGGYMNDGKSPNAYATPDQKFRNGPDGTVVFGISLAEDELRRDNGVGIGIPAILAHEFAHIRQFKTGLSNTYDVPTMELHADFMSGWYMARRSQYRIADIRPAMQAFYDMGDYGFNNPNHHGTPAQRLAAFQAGFQSGQLSLASAWKQGVTTVQQIRR